MDLLNCIVLQLKDQRIKCHKGLRLLLSVAHYGYCNCNVSKLLVNLPCAESTSKSPDFFRICLRGEFCLY